MIWALEGADIAALFATDHSTPVRAGIQQDSYLIITTTRQNNRTARDAARAEVARLGNLRFMPRINPAALKHALVLKCKQLRTAEHLAIDTKQSGFAIVDDEILKLRGVHSQPPSFQW